MRILVTGAAGFIGSHLVNHYAKQGHDVFGIDNYEDSGDFDIDHRVNILWGDIRRCDVRKVICKIKPDLISHHAAKIDPRCSMETPIDDVKTNYIGTINVVEGARESGCDKIIFASSCAVYGDIGATSTMVEGQFELPNCPYGISKLASEKYLHVVSRTSDGIRVVVLRYPNVYGPGQSGARSTGVIAIFARLIAQNKPVTVYGDGTAQYQYMHINDILGANDAAIKWFDKSNQSFLLANIAGRPASVNDILAMLSKHFDNYSVSPEYAAPRNGEQYQITMRGSAASKSLGWTPKITLEEGISDVANKAKKDSKKVSKQHSRDRAVLPATRRKVRK